MESIVLMLPLAQVVEVATGLAGLLFLVAWIWLMVIAFKDHVGWGLLVLLLPGIGGLVYGIVKWPYTLTPLVLLVVSFVLAGGFVVGNPLI